MVAFKMEERKKEEEGKKTIKNNKVQLKRNMSKFNCCEIDSLCWQSMIYFITQQLTNC